MPKANNYVYRLNHASIKYRVRQEHFSDVLFFFLIASLIIIVLNARSTYNKIYNNHTHTYGIRY